MPLFRLFQNGTSLSEEYYLPLEFDKISCGASSRHFAHVQSLFGRLFGDKCREYCSPLGRLRKIFAEERGHG